MWSPYMVTWLVSHWLLDRTRDLEYEIICYHCVSVTLYLLQLLTCFKSSVAVCVWLPSYQGGYQVTKVVTKLPRWLPSYQGGYQVTKVVTKLPSYQGGYQVTKVVPKLLRWFPSYQGGYQVGKVVTKLPRWLPSYQGGSPVTKVVTRLPRWLPSYQCGYQVTNLVTKLVTNVTHCYLSAKSQYNIDNANGCLSSRSRLDHRFANFQRKMLSQPCQKLQVITDR